MRTKTQKILALGAIVLSIGLSLAPSAVWARATSASANTFHPAIDSSPYVTVYGSQTMQPWRYHFGAYFNYAKNPLEVGLGGVRRFGVIDHLLVGEFFGSLGITDWFQLGLSVPVALYEDFNNFAAGTSSKTLRMMDVKLETKFRLLDIDRHKFGIAILPYITFPTGSGTRFVGNNSFAGGAKLILDGAIGSRVQLGANFGYMMRDRFTFATTEQDDQFTYGVGISIRAVKNWLDVIAEVHGNANATNFFSRQAETPLEVDGALRFNLPKPEGLSITAGGGAGMTFGYGSPDLRAFLGLSYPNPKRVNLPIPPPPPEETLARVEKTKIVITKKIHFEFDRAVIRPVSFRILDAVVDILKQNPDIRKVRIEGHTDSKGSDAYNMRLSQRRANAVRDYIIAHGIEADRLVAVGYGESRAVDTNDTAEGRARNRRVEFQILDE